MDPSLVIWGIRATLRAAQAGANLYGEHARDRKIWLLDLELPEGTRTVQLGIFLDEHRDLIDRYPALAACWNRENNMLGTTATDKIDAAYAVMVQVEAERKLKEKGNDEKTAQRDAEILAGGTLIEQWREERQPPNAFVRFALTLTDIGLEFVEANPSVFGAGSRGEKLIAAFAGKLSDLIPSDMAAFGPKADFADRVFAVFLRAGLATLADNSAIIFRDEDVAQLVAGITMPVVNALPEDIASQVIYRDLVDALAGPSAVAAFRLLADNTSGYHGKDFADNKALGAVTGALFRQIQVITHATSSIVDVFSEEGLVELYKAALGLAMERPGLFIGTDGSAKTELFENLLSGTARVLLDHPRFEGPVGASVAAMVVTTVGNQAPALLKLDPNDPWEATAIRTLEHVSAGLSAGRRSGGQDDDIKGALRSFSNGQLLKLARIVLDGAAKTPGMLGVQSVEVRSILSGMAAAMAADDNLLLSADEWVEIAAVAARQAAANPGRLFGIDTADTEGALAVTLIRSILDLAGKAWSSGRTGGALLFGETLHAAIEAMLEELAGNITAVAKDPAVVERFLSELLERARANPDKFGSEGFLMVFTLLIGTVLAQGALPTDEMIDKALATGEGVRVWANSRATA